MSWTDERVTKLQEMWNEGLSAAQIARELGGVTRNAVIGKVHRLGLSNRNGGPGRPSAAGEPEGAPAEMAAQAPDAPAQSASEAPEPDEAPALAVESVEPPQAEPAPEAAAPEASQAPRILPANQRREPQPMSEDRLEVLANLAEIEKTARRVSLLDLTERLCKWPIGDPTDANFHFCGLPAVPGKPYCSAHVAVAFQPMSSRRDRDRARVRS